MTPAKRAGVLIAGFAVLVGLTLDNTRPYRGDEAYYIASSIDMLQSGDVLVPRYFGEIRLQKPILTYWITALGYRAAGVHLWSGRLPFLVLAAGLLVLVYRFSRRLHEDPELALLNVALLASSTLFLEASRIAMSDLPLTCFTTLSLFFYCRALEEPGGGARKFSFAASLAAGAAVASKGPFGLLAPAAVAAFVVAGGHGGRRQGLASLFSPVNVAAIAIVGGAWYGYAWWTLAQAFVQQAGVESEASFGVRPLSALAHVVFYAGVIVALHVPAVAMAMYASLARGWRRARWPGIARLRSLPAPAGPLAWAVVLCVAAAILLLARHKERYLLVVTPAIVMLAGTIIHRAGLARRVRGTAIAAGLLQVAVFLAYPHVVGRPLHELVAHWERHLEGDLGSALSRRETTWVEALSGGRLTRDASQAAYLLMEETGALPPGYDVVRAASERSRIWWEDGRLRTRWRRYLLVRVKGEGGQVCDCTS